MPKLLPVSLALALAAPFGALADTQSDINALRHEIDAMRAAYEARLQALEQRLKAAEASAATPVPPVATAAPAAPAASGTPLSGAPVIASSGGGANAFNPAISLILSGAYARTSQDPANYAISGFQLPAGAEVGPGTRGFSLAESELGFRRQHRPLAARRGQHRTASRRRGLGRGGLRPDHLARQRSRAEGRPLLLRRRLSQFEARPHLGLRRQPAGLPGLARHAIRRRWRAS